ncbi:dihydrodipicolinate synthase family protein [Paenibacillus cymbidii]|uniref:dihydrodipicolinate synthase family protein n=1 Tax=Paenibacillus cymbidii TaxID=1639034 RepID=UPI001080E867|nr:dihydrodipicolinate synthase family protein [Paenibacillus cymbidii]
MSVTIADGIWPTMITPFTETSDIDYVALERLIEWYIEGGVDGLFAVCQSSEMFYLTLEERTQLARFVRESAAGRVPVIASGHVSDAAGDQLAELQAIASTGVDAVVLVTNRLARPDETDETWKRNAERIMQALPDVTLGLYECPSPYKRLLPPELLRWCADTGRFAFLKDTSCDPRQIATKLKAVRGTPLRLFNANAATLLESLKDGAAGYSGIMANFHPDLYAALFRFVRAGEWMEAERLQSYLGLASVIERQLYPANAKYHARLEGLPLRVKGRSSAAAMTISMEYEVAQLRAAAETFRATFRQ